MPEQSITGTNGEQALNDEQKTEAFANQLCNVFQLFPYTVFSEGEKTLAASYGSIPNELICRLAIQSI